MLKFLAISLLLLSLSACSQNSQENEKPKELTRTVAPIDIYRPSVEDIKKAYRKNDPGLGPEAYECIAEAIYASPLSADGVKALIASPGERNTDYTDEDLTWLNSDEQPISRILEDCLPGAIIIDGNG